MTARTTEQYVPTNRKLILLLAIVLGGTLAVGALALQQPILAIGGVVAVLLVMSMFIWPEGVTLFVFFVLYTNAAVVAVRYHGVPFIAGAALPALLIFPFGFYLVFRRKELVLDKVVPLMVVMLLVYVLGTLFAADLNIAVDNLINFAIEGLVLYVLVINAVRTPKVLRLAVWVLIIAGLLMGGISFYQQITQTYDNNYGGFAQMSDAAFGTGEENILGEVEQPRLGGPLGQQNRFAQIMLMLVPLALYQLWSKQAVSLRLLAAVSTVLILIGVVLTFSRGAAVGFGLMLVVMAAMRYIKPHRLLIVLVALLLLLQAFPQFGARLDSLTVITDLLSNDGTTISSADGATRSRATEMLAAVLMFAEHPVVGVGPGMYPQNYQEYATRVGIRVLRTTRESHSLPLGLAAEAGLFGLLAFGMILFVTLRELDRNRKKFLKSSPNMAYILTGLFLSIIVFLTTSLFLHFAYIRYFWLIMGLAGAANYIAKNMPATNAAAQQDSPPSLTASGAG